MSDEKPTRSSISDELEVPSEQPTSEDDDHILPLDDLCYPTLTFEDGHISPTRGIHLEDSFDREGVQSILRDLDGALTSHDLCIADGDRRVIFGIGPGDVTVDFTPDKNHLGRLEFTISLRAKALTYADEDTPEVGARGGKGFIPKAMLTGDIEPGKARCYNWIDDPVEGLELPEEESDQD